MEKCLQKKKNQKGLATGAYIDTSYDRPKGGGGGTDRIFTHCCILLEICRYLSLPSLLQTSFKLLLKALQLFHTQWSKIFSEQMPFKAVENQVNLSI